MKRFRTIFMWVVAVAVMLLFAAGVLVAGGYSLWFEGAPRPQDMPGIVSYFVSAVNGTLAANLGAVLGISISLHGWRDPATPTEKLQWAAAGWYVFILLVAAAIWAVAKFTEDPSKVVSLLPEMTKNAVGIFIAILAAVLGVQTAITRSTAIAEEKPPRSLDGND